MRVSHTYLCFDYGLRRIGVAVGQDLTCSANALGVVAVRDGHPDWDAIARFVNEWRPDAFVLGMPNNADGAPHVLHPAITRFAEHLSSRFGCRVAFIDEHLSSYAAEHDPQTRKLGIDAVAARHILESWLATQGTVA
jgi:putative holliday junction resolvase